MRDEELDAALLDAHASADRVALMRLYRLAGDRSEAAGDTAAACFFWTQAYVWALDAGQPDANDLHARLKARGREE